MFKITDFLDRVYWQM